MKNRFLRIIGALSVTTILAFNVQAQDAREVSTKFNKMQKTAYQADYKVSKDLMKTTLADRFKKAGLKGKKSKGYTKFEGVAFPELSSNKLDIYTKVEGKKNNATVLMLVSLGYDNFVSTASDPATAGNTITFLNKLNDDASAMQASIDLAAQQKAVKEAEEKLKKSEQEKEKLAQKRAKLDKQLEAEGKAGAKAGQQVEAEKLRLENIKGKNGE